MRAASPHQRPIVEVLEPKLLYSADLAPLAMGADSVGLIDNPVATQNVQALTHGTATHEVVFIDASVPELGALQRDFAAQQATGRDIEVIVIRSDEDGLARISEVLQAQQNVAAVHLISHGSDGQVQLGSTVLDAQTLLQRASDVAQWGSAFSADGDLLIYGCDVAQSSSGRAFLQDLAALTGADVAASNDSTGQQALGGDWVLEAHTGTIEADIALSNTAQDSWSHTLALGLTPPVITSNGGGSTATIQVNENTTAVTTVTAMLLDNATSTLTYSITGGGDAGKFKIDASSGVLSFRNAPNYESPRDTNGDNAYKVVVSVSDGYNSDSQNITVEVLNVNEAPLITSDGGSGYTIIQVPTGSTAITQTHAVDPEGDAVIYSISNAQDGSLMTIDASTGVLSFRNPVDITNDRSVSGENIYQVFVYAKDAGGAYDAQWVIIQITDPAPLNQSPVIDSNGGGESATLTVLEGQTSVTTVHATDADTTTLHYSIIGGADQALFDIDATSGLLTFKASPNATAPLDADQDNVYEVIVSATDGNTSDSQTLGIQVLAYNRAPINTLPANLSAQEDTALTITGLAVTDVDAGNNAITVSLEVQHGTLIVRDDVAGGLQASQIQHGSLRQVTLTGTVAEINATLAAVDGLRYRGDADFSGSDTLIMVSNDQGHSGLASNGTQPSAPLTDADQATITIAAVDDAPSITTNTLDISQGGTAIPDIQISDVDSSTAALGVRVQSISGGQFIDTVTGLTVAQFTLGQLQAGTIAFVHTGGATAPSYTLVAFDASGDSAVSSATVTFNATPVITSDGGGATATVNATEFNTQVTTVQASDTDSGTLSYAIVGGVDQAFFSIDTATGSLSFAFTPDVGTAPFDTHARDYTVIVAASDGSTSAQQTLTVHLNTFNRAPSNTLPTSGYSTSEDTPLVLSGLRIDDLEAGVNDITVTLSVQHGTLSVRTDVGGGLVPGQLQHAANGRSVVLTGTVAAINATLADSQGLLYRPDADVNGIDTLTMVSSDLGHSGLDSSGTQASGPLTTTSQTAIAIAAVDDAPVLTINTLAIDQNGSATPVVQVSDVDTPASALALSVQNLSGGRFVHVDSGATVTQFSLADAQAGLITFVHDGSGQAPAYVLVVSDGHASVSSAATVSFTPAPVAPATATSPSTTSGSDASSSSTGNSSEAPVTSEAAASGAAALPAQGAASLPVAGPADAPQAYTQPTDIRVDAPLVKVSIDGAERATNISAAPTAGAEAFQYSWSSSLATPGAAEDLRRNLDALHDQLQDSGLERRHVVASSIALSTGLSVGYVIWLIRGGALLGSMLSAMPAWQMIDPLPVLHRGGGRGQSIDLGDGDATVENLFDGDAPPPPPPPPPPPTVRPPVPPQPPEARA